MGYQALLFCSDEKTARLVTQVLTELDFTVEPANEPFAAVKRLTTQHFDAVVVDCENEQNGSLLFKTARNSGPNRTSLAVAVVEGQPGIAKAFRIGANLVLTKPINVEQSKGTLRVARGLLKKSDANKPAAAQPIAPVASAPSVSPRSLTPAPPAPRAVVPPRSLTTPPAPFVRAEASSGLELDQDPVPQPEPADAALLESMPEPAAPPAPRAAAPRLTPKPAPWAPPKSAPSTGTAAGTAPAKEFPTPRFDSPEVSAPSTAGALPRRASEAAHRAEVAPAPVFSAGQAKESGGSSKGIIIGLVAVVLVAGGYFGWTKFHSTSVAPSVSAPAQSAPVQSAPKPSASAPTSATQAQPAATSASEPQAPSAQRATAQPVEEEPEVIQRPVASVPKPAHESITVKSSASKSAAAEAPQAIPVIGMATGGSDKEISGLIAGTTRTPVLRTMKVSQGVSQGLIVKRVPPDYPMQARQLRIEGAVQLEATINKEGNVSNVKVLGGHPILARAATDAIKQWKYKPYMLNGNPVEIETQITINFKLP